MPVKSYKDARIFPGAVAQQGAGQALAGAFPEGGTVRQGLGRKTLGALAVGAALAVAAGAVSGCGGANPAAADPTELPDGEGALGEWVASGGLRRTYSLHLPPSYDGSRPWPLLLAFHGAGGNSGFVASVGLDQAAARAGFVLAAPNGVEGDWALGCGGCTAADAMAVDDVHFVETLIAHLARHLSVDLDRVFVAGRSDGASFSNRLACELPLAGAAVVAGTQFTPGGCRPAHPVSVVSFHGSNDSIIPFGSGALLISSWARLDGCGPEPTVTPLPDLEEDGTVVWRYDFPACQDGSEVVFFGVEGGSHSWPGGPRSEGSGQTHDIQASEELVDFFSRHRSAP